MPGVCDTPFRLTSTISRQPSRGLHEHQIYFPASNFRPRQDYRLWHATKPKQANNWPTSLAWGPERSAANAQPFHTRRLVTESLESDCWHYTTEHANQGCTRGGGMLATQVGNGYARSRVFQSLRCTWMAGTVARSSARMERKGACSKGCEALASAHANLAKPRLASALGHVPSRTAKQTIQQQCEATGHAGFCVYLHIPESRI